MEVRSELWCHGCNSYVQFTLDDSLNGNHEIICPKCGHLHYRYINNGVISEGRMMNSNQYFYSASNVTSTATSTYDVYQSVNAQTGSVFTYSSWMNATGTGG